METMKQVRAAYRKAQKADPTLVSLAQFARDDGVYNLVKAAHKDAAKPRSEATASRTRLASAARKTSSKTTTVKKPIEVVKSR